jgi:hypothetical protein
LFNQLAFGDMYHELIRIILRYMAQEAYRPFPDIQSSISTVQVRTGRFAFQIGPEWPTTASLLRLRANGSISNL